MNRVAQFFAVLPVSTSFAGGSEFPPALSSADVARLMKFKQLVRGLREQELMRLVPLQSGFRYVDCPNCFGGRQENPIEWEPVRPDEVACAYCVVFEPNRLRSARALWAINCEWESR